MARFGFIHDKLDIKFLVLYLMARVSAPIPFSELTDLTMCDDGVDYFDYTEAVAELVETGHLLFEADLYAITEKGRRNGQACESSLPYSVRAKCERNLARVNAVLRRNAQVRAEVSPRPDGGFTLRLTLDDETDNLLTLDLLVATEQLADRLADRFREVPEQIHRGILDVLLNDRTRGEG